MNYTEEQFNALAPFERNFRRAVLADWYSGITPTEATTIERIYKEATGSTEHYGQSCANCIKRLLKDAGRLWLADQTEREPAEQPKKARRARK